jgi:hypothetical protein
MRWPVAAGIFCALVWTGAAAADPRSEAAALVNAQQAIIAGYASATPTAATVPGYGGQAAHLHGYADNGPALASDGQAAAPGSTIFAVSRDAAEVAAGVGVSNADAWLQRSVTVANNPAAYSGGAQGSDSASCGATPGGQTVQTETLYTCESGTRVAEETTTCTRVFRPDLSGQTGQVGWAYYTCQEGYRDDPGSRTCEVPLQVTTSTQYKYECELLTYWDNGWNQESVRCGQFLSAGCTRTGTYKKSVPRQPCHFVYQYSCPRAVTDTPNNETKIWNMGTVAGTPTAAWNETACQALAADATCTLQSEVCIEGAGTRTINGQSIYQSCWKKRRTYSCSNITQGAGCHPPAGAQYLSQTCLWADAAGICRLIEKTSRYMASISGPGGTWAYEPACPAIGDTACAQSGAGCLEGAQTRIVGGIAVTAACWKESVTFQCTRASGQGSDCQAGAGCTKKEERCLDAACKTVEHVYSCKSSESAPGGGTSCAAQICMGGQCYGLQDQTSTDLPAAFASLAVMEAAGEDQARGVSLFKGDGLRCKKAVLGFRNCCKDSGWGLDLGLAQCDEQEQLLIQRQQAKACHYVGTWCSKDSLFGCIEKSMRYCCFEGVLGRIVQQAGHVQLGKSWGTPQAPDCSGFTVEQFQQLDLSKVDFSEFTRAAMKNIAVPGQGGTVSAIQQSLERLYGSGQPGSGG